MPWDGLFPEGWASVAARLWAPRVAGLWAPPFFARAIVGWKGGVLTVAGTQGLWCVDADGVVSVADCGVLREVAEDAVRERAVADGFVDSCVELFFRVLRACGCAVSDEGVALVLSGAVSELVEAVLPGERELVSCGASVVAAGLACVGDVVCGAAFSVAASGDVVGEARRIVEGARLIAASGGGL